MRRGTKTPLGRLTWDFWVGWSGRAAVGLVLLGLAGIACEVAVGPEGDPGPGGGSSGSGGTAAGGLGGASMGTGGSTEDLDDLNGVGPTTVDLACDEDGPVATSPLLKLSTLQYRNTVRDLLERLGWQGLVSEVDPLLAVIPADSLGDSFRGLDDRIAIEHVQGFFDIGVAIGDALLEEPALLTSAFGDCVAETQLSEQCWRDVVTKFVSLAHRRPPRGTEIDLYDELNDGMRSGAEAVRALIIVSLSTPHFLYQVEVDGDAIDNRDDLFALDAYAVASRLSYTFWQTMPDDELFLAASDGSLLDPETYDEQLRRVWEDPRAEDTIRQFYTEWLKLEKFTGFETSRPGFQALTEGEFFGSDGHDYYADMVREIEDLTSYFTFEAEGTLSDLLSTNISVTQSSDLASLYGVEAWDGKGEFPMLQNRAGLLQRAALLVSNLEQTNPFHRGALLRRAILCDELPQPDPNELPPGSLDPPPVDEAQTTRQRFSAKVEGNSLCEGCHATFSNIGYVMESFDAVGRFRTVEKVFDEQTGDLLAQLSIDTEAAAAISSLGEPSVRDAGELNERIVSSGKVEACLAKSYLSYALRRAVQSSSLDACVVEDLSSLLSATDGGLSAAFRRVAEMPTFFTRKVGSR